MGFKSLTTFKEERKGNFFQLSDDGDFADVVFLYQSADDVLIADVHYIKSSEYSGYAHCCGAGCPACAFRGANGGRIGLDSKLFIPLYNIGSGKIEFFDRSAAFEHYFTRDVLTNYANPSEYVFRITRHGDYKSRDTRYEIKAIAKNTSMPYEKILADAGVTLPDYYSSVVRELTIDEMSRMLSSDAGPAPTEEYNYGATPRNAYMPPEDAIPDPVSVPTPTAVIPEEAPAVEMPELPEGITPADDSADDLSDVDF